MHNSNDPEEADSNCSEDDLGTSRVADGPHGPPSETVAGFELPRLHRHQHRIALAGVVVTALVFGVMAYSLWLQRDFGRRQLNLIEQQRDISNRLADIEVTAISPFIRPVLDSVDIFQRNDSTLLHVKYSLHNTGYGPAMNVATTKALTNKTREEVGPALYERVRVRREEGALAWLFPNQSEPYPGELELPLPNSTTSVETAYLYICWMYDHPSGGQVSCFAAFYILLSYHAEGETVIIERRQGPEYMDCPSLIPTDAQDLGSR